MFIGALITAIGYATLPTIRFPFELIGGVQGEGTAALNTISSQTLLATQISTFAEILVWAWTAVLASILVRTFTEFSWPKSVAIAVIAYLITIIVAAFIG
jgi:tetrahydromethanopterin S-methyltransferase subunit D